MTKTRTRTVDRNSHKENCEDFLIFDWDFGKVEEYFPFSAQTWDHFISTSWIYEAYHFLNLFKTPSQIHYRNMKVNNLSKFPSLALFFIWKEVSLVCFVSLKKKTCETRKNIFTLLRKGSWDFNFSDIQISWRHQMSEHETQNRFHWITWEVNKVWQLNLSSLCYIAKETFLSKNSKKIRPGN